MNNDIFYPPHNKKKTIQKRIKNQKKKKNRLSARRRRKQIQKNENAMLHCREKKLNTRYSIHEPYPEINMHTCEESDESESSFSLIKDTKSCCSVPEKIKKESCFFSPYIFNEKKEEKDPEKLDHKLFDYWIGLGEKDFLAVGEIKEEGERMSLYKEYQDEEKIKDQLMEYIISLKNLKNEEKKKRVQKLKLYLLTICKTYLDLH